MKNKEGEPVTGGGKGWESSAESRNLSHRGGEKSVEGTVWR